MNMLCCEVSNGDKGLILFHLHLSLEYEYDLQRSNGDNWLLLPPCLGPSLIQLTSAACGIRCYECVHNNQRVKRHNRFVYPCSEFDDSERYIMDCPDSNMCIYQRITLPLSSGMCVCVCVYLPSCIVQGSSRVHSVLSLYIQQA